jgi:hypothetical protein
MAIPPPLQTTLLQKEILKSIGAFFLACYDSGIPLNPRDPLWNIIDGIDEDLDEDEKSELYDGIIKLLVTIKNI